MKCENSFLEPLSSIVFSPFLYYFCIMFHIYLHTHTHTQPQHIPSEYFCSVLLLRFFFLNFNLFKTDRERERAQGRGRGRRRSRLTAEQGGQCRAQSCPYFCSILKQELEIRLCCTGMLHRYGIKISLIRVTTNGGLSLKQ